MCPNLNLKRLKLKAIKASDSKSIPTMNSLTREILGIESSAMTMDFLGTIFFKAEEYRRAIEFFEQVSKADPKTEPKVSEKISVCLIRLERYQEASALLTDVIRKNPSNIQNFLNLAFVMSQTDQVGKAIKLYQAALKIDPENEDALLNIGILFNQLNQPQRAEQSLLALIAIKPDSTEAWYTLGNLYAESRDYQKAQNALKRCLKIDPRFEMALASLGALNLQLRRPTVSIRYLKSQLDINPQNHKAMSNLATAFQQKGEHKEALYWYSEAVRVEPNFAIGWSQLINAQSLTCDYSVFDNDWIINGPIEGGKAPFTFLALEDSPDRQLERSIDFWKNRNPEYKAIFNGQVNFTEKKITVGYFSADFKAHATSFLMRKLIATHDRTKFRIIIFDYTLTKDKYTEEIRDLADEYYDVVQMSNAELVSLAISSNLGLAIDLKGYTEFSRWEIFSQRLAPVQIGYVGYPGSSGAPWMDYLIADRIVVPPEYRPSYSESIAYLPNAYQPTDNDRSVMSDCVVRSDFSLPEKMFIFCGFNQNYKITPSEISCWAKILKEVPNSIIWLLKSNELAKHNILNEFEKFSISSQRVLFAEHCAPDKHLARLGLADLFLDTFNVNAHTGTSDALWMGVPVLTKLGKQFAARVAGSLVTNAGLPELVVHSQDEYVKLAISIATDPGRCRQLKAKLNKENSRSKLFDSEQYVADLEALYLEIWSIYAAGGRPRDIGIH